MFHCKRNTAALKKALAEGLLVVDTETAEIRNKNGKLLTQWTNVFGYKRVQLRIDGKNVSFYVHKVVYFAAHGEPEFGLQIHHKDKNRANNADSNLEAISRDENLADREWPKAEPAF